MTEQTREQLLYKIIDELFQIATPGATKNALWQRYLDALPLQDKQEPAATVKHEKSYEELDEEIQELYHQQDAVKARYLASRHEAGYPSEPTMDERAAEAMHLFSQALTQEPQEDSVTLVKCPYCSGSHPKFMVDLCPLNPTRPR